MSEAMSAEEEFINEVQSMVSMWPKALYDEVGTRIHLLSRIPLPHLLTSKAVTLHTIPGRVASKSSHTRYMHI